LSTSAKTPYFNVSHSSCRAIYALGLSELGVDLEFVRSIPGVQELVDQHFSTAERGAFAFIPPDLKMRAFYSCWTRKEAYVKACGGGLSIPLDQFDVSVDPGLPARLVRVQETPGDQLRWSLYSFEPSTDTVAAVVCAKDSVLHLCGYWSVPVTATELRIQAPNRPQ
jgi:4'-phosphopantetheinyl transferase